MTHQTREHRDALENDRRVNGGGEAPRKHGTSCRCIRCIGPERYRMETARLKAKHDARNYPSPPRRAVK